VEPGIFCFPTTVTILVTFTIFAVMRVIAVKTLKGYAKIFPQAEQAILSWYEEIEKAEWNSPNELKEQYHHASIISEKRVVFNIHGNSFRLIVDIEYRLKIVFIVWFGTHKQYNKLDAKKVIYDKAN
jgi:mRNA interferase HigB